MKFIRAEIDGQTFYPDPENGKFNFPPECNGKRAAFTVECTAEELDQLRLEDWSVVSGDETAFE
jgi:hypothetical protein